MWEKVINYLQYLFSSYNPILIFIELLLIGFVVYSVMRFLRGTGGERLFKGFVVLLMGFWLIRLITGSLGLERIDFLFNYFFIGVLVVAAIAFQPELRRGLMQLGGTRFGRDTLPEMEDVIEKIVDTAATLSRTQIGGIIALEREVGLGDLVAGGIPLNAKVTSELLNTIFWPGSPLHDMGVVIRQDRLAAAGVQFPLAEHGEYDRLLGSRHRAAIGLSKETDAVVVVMSEETGNIGLAVNGKLTRFLTIEQLRIQLLELLIPVAAGKGKRAQKALTRFWEQKKTQQAVGPKPADAKTKKNEPNGSPLPQETTTPSSE
jgi:diadenylate cyclase